MKTKNENLAFKRSSFLIFFSLGLCLSFAYAEQDSTGNEQSKPITLDTNLEIIEVSALRRNSSIQTVPVSVTAYTKNVLESAFVKDIKDLETLSPSLDVTQALSSASSSISIRGIGTRSDNPGFEPAVGVIIDGVFRSRTGIALSELTELERVEVLRGPQGTLFGKNTSAGAIIINSTAPSFDTQGYAELGLGNLGAREARAAFNKGLNEHWAIRINGSVRQRDGFIDDVNSEREFNNIDRSSLRAQAQYYGDELSARIIIDSASSDEDCCAAINVVRGAASEAVSAIAAFQGLIGIAEANLSDFKVAGSPNRPINEGVDDFGVSVNLEWEAFGANLSSVSAYRNWDLARDQDLDFSGIDRIYREDYQNNVRDIQQEFKAQGEGLNGRLDYILGAFYSHQNLSLTDTIRFGDDANVYIDALVAGVAGVQLFGALGPNIPLALPIPVTPSASGEGQQADNFDVSTQSFALFSHNVLALSDKLSATVGIRLMRETKDIDANLNAISGPCSFYLDPNNAPFTQGLLSLAGGAAVLLSCNSSGNPEFNGTYDGSRTENALTGSLKLAYQMNEQSMVFAAYDKGYKAGGFNLDRGGFDSVLFGGNGAQLSDLEFEEETVNAFELGIKNSLFNNRLLINGTLFYQDFSDYQSLVFSGTNFIVQNVEKTISQGIETEISISPSDNLQVSLAYTYNEAEFDEGLDLINSPLDGLQGEQFSEIPRSAFAANIIYRIDVAADMNLMFHSNIRTASSTRLEANALAPFNEGSRIVGASIELADNAKTWLLALSVNNVFAEEVFTAGFFVPEQEGRFAGFPNSPRQIMLSARYNF